MNKILLSLVLILPLLGCASIKSDFAAVKAVGQVKILNPLNEKTVYGLSSILDADAILLDDYSQEPKCPSGSSGFGAVGGDGKYCHDPILLKQWNAAAVVAQPALHDLVSLEKAHPVGTVIFGGSLAEKFGEVQQLIAAVTSYAAAYQKARK